MEQRTQEWFAARASRITASEAGALLDMSPFKSGGAAFKELVGKVHGTPSKFVGNVATTYGTFNEDGALMEYEWETGNKVNLIGFVEHSDWLGASPDGMVGDDGMLEIKCPFGLRNNKSPDFKNIDDLPHYYAQTQIQMFCAQRDYCDFFQWNQFATSLERVYRDEAWLSENLPELKAIHEQALRTSPLGV